MPDKYGDLKERIRAIFDQHHGRYGYRRITATLQHLGEKINHKTVQRLMGIMGLKSTVRPKKFRSFKGDIGTAEPNELARQFSADGPNQKWVTDVTEFSIDGDKLYLSPILDLYNAEIIAFETSRRPVFGMVVSMIKKAFAKLLPQEKPMLHSDQGWQYRMASYKAMLGERGLVQSMSRKGNCHDNATMESFFGILKTEYFYQRKFSSIEELQNGLSEYIRYYNYDRIKLRLNGLSPVSYRTQAMAKGC
jgi:putative transposase